MTFDVEFVEPADTRDDLRAILAPFFDNGALPAGETFDHLRMLATHASGKPGARTRRELSLPQHADWRDAVDAVEAEIERRRSRVGAAHETTQAADNPAPEPDAGAKPTDSRKWRRAVKGA